MVTGAGSGIGRAVALGMAREGARVMVSDLNVDGGQETLELLKAQGADALFEAADVGHVEHHRQLVARTVREVFPGAVVAPGLMLGGTDSRWFDDISDNVFRFSPIRTRQEDLSRFHGTDERLSVAHLAEMIRFYHRLLSQSAS